MEMDKTEITVVIPVQLLLYLIVRELDSLQ